MPIRRDYYEFFAGGGMVRSGLGPAWACLFANDIDGKKAAAYGRNWGSAALRIADVAALSSSDLPGTADLAWASFPCQDLSLAGTGAGLEGTRSGSFWGFWRLIQSLAREGRAPALVVLENVCGALTSHAGKDFAALCAALAGEGYRFGAMVIDAVRFVPQSRPRLFLLAVSDGTPLPQPLMRETPHPAWSPPVLLEAYGGVARPLRHNWLWWDLPVPAAPPPSLAELLEENPRGVRWHTELETQRLLELMAPPHRARVDEQRRRSGQRSIGMMYRRTRHDGNGRRVQRAEVRFDGVAGCLRTPAGGSSRQSVLIVETGRIRSRLLSPREAARLMGLPDSYTLPDAYNDAYHLAGDGVAVPVVRHLAAHLLEPLLDARAELNSQMASIAAASRWPQRSRSPWQEPPQ